MTRLLPILLTILLVPALLGGCGDTWSGAKKDTADNVDAVGEGLEKTGEEIQKTTK